MHLVISKLPQGCYDTAMEKHPPVTVRISTSSLLSTLLILGLCVLLYYLRDLVLIVLAAIVISAAIQPAISWFIRNKIPRVLAVVLVYLLIGTALVAIFSYILPQLISDTVSFLRNLDHIDLLSALGQGGASDGSAAFSLKDVITSLGSALSNVSSGFLVTASSIFGGAFSFIIILVLSFYLSVREDGISEFLELIIPAANKDYVLKLWQRAEAKIGYWMQGQLLLGAVVGILVFAGLSAVGVPHALVLAVLAALFEIIPLFGPILAAIPGIAVAFSFGGIKFAIFAAILYVIIQQLENHVLYPLVVNKIIGISPILVIVGLIAGLKLGGILGALLSVPILIVLMEYYADAKNGKVAAAS